MKPRSEQFWELGLRGPLLSGLQTLPEYVHLRYTRSRLSVFQHLRKSREDGYGPVAREVWTVGGKFDGECYASGEWERA